MSNPNYDQERFGSILDKLANVPTASFEVGPIDGFLLVSYLQLACRHPEAGGITGKRMEELARTIQDALASRVPEVGELLERGWHRENDIPRLVVECEASEDFSSLHMYRQMEIVTQVTALGITCDLLSKMLPLPSDQIMADALRKAEELVKQMPEIEISIMIDDLDRQHHEFYQTNQTDDNN